jgi:hypothetical protein
MLENAEMKLTLSYFINEKSLSLRLWLKVISANKK